MNYTVAHDSFTLLITYFPVCQRRLLININLHARQNAILITVYKAELFQTKLSDWSWWNVEVFLHPYNSQYSVNVNDRWIRMKQTNMHSVLFKNTVKGTRFTNKSQVFPFLYDYSCCYTYHFNHVFHNSIHFLDSWLWKVVSLNYVPVHKINALRQIHYISTLPSLSTGLLPLRMHPSERGRVHIIGIRLHSQSVISLIQQRHFSLLLHWPGQGC